MTALRSGFFAALIGLLCAGTIGAQQPTAKSDTQADYVPSMTFDVASIREGKSSPQGWSISFVDPPHSSLLKLTNNDVPNLLEVAYGVNPAQLVGLPDWTQGFYAPHFNVDAKSDDSVNAQLAKLTDEQARLEKQHMFQALLAERFQLKVHWETKEGSIYELVIAKNGPKLRPGGSMPPSSEELHNWGDRKIPPISQHGSSVTGFEFIGHQCSLDSLAKMLSGSIRGTPVVNRTGLAGTYDFVLKYYGSTLDDASDDPSMPRPLMEALPDQLGLKVQPAKGPQQFLVIDHMERPSEN